MELSVRRHYVDVNIYAGSAVSEIVDLERSVLTGLLIPAGMVGNEIAFDAGGPNAAGTGIGMFPLYDHTDDEVVIAVGGVDRYIDTDRRHFWGVRFISLKTRTNGVQVVQNADIVVRLIVGE
jgi:hypothetical protein